MTQAGRRLIALDPGTIAELRAHKAVQTEERLLRGPACQDRDLVFCRPDGHPHDVDVACQRFDSAVTRAGVKRIRFHDLRHTHATLLVRAGAHLKVVQERLGQASISITSDRYSHLRPGHAGRGRGQDRRRGGRELRYPIPEAASGLQPLPWVKRWCSAQQWHRC